MAGMTPPGWAAAAPKDYFTEISRGKVPGHSWVNKFGRNEDVDTGAEEDIWDGGGSWSNPTTARTHAIVSASSTDASSSPGARTVWIQGLNSSWAIATERVTLNGATAVNTSGIYNRIFRMAIKSAGASAKNVGAITATAATDSTVTAKISAGANQTLMAIYTVASGNTGYLNSYYASMNRLTTSGAANIFLKVRDSGEVYQTKHIMGLIGAGKSQFQHRFDPPLKISGKADIKISSDVSANNTDISSGFDMVMIKD